MDEHLQAPCAALVDTLARALATARLTGTTVPRPDFRLTLEQAYAVQARVTALMGMRQVGWKVGSTSKVAQARLGTDEPGAGPLLSPLVHRCGDRVPVFSSHHVHVEVEFAFRMATTLPSRARPYDANAVRAAIGAFIPGMELVGCRFTEGLQGSGRALVTADGGASIAFAGGPEVPVDAHQDYRSRPCTLTINGRPAARGKGAAALGDPIRVLTWLTNHLRGRGLDLEAGSIVTTGTCTGLVAVAPGDRLSGDFGELGRVSVDLVDGHDPSMVPSAT